MREATMSAPAAFAADDEAAVALARTDRSAFAVIYLRYRDPVYAYMLRFTRSPEDAADLTATTFERAISRLDHYRGDGAGFAAWLFRIARNAATDRARRGRRWRPFDLLRDDRAAEVPMPEAAWETRETAARLISRLDQLSPVQRECVVLRYAAGLTTAQIAGVIGKTEAATQKQISRALARLKEAYRDDDR